MTTKTVDIIYIIHCSTILSKILLTERVGQLESWLSPLIEPHLHAYHNTCIQQFVLPFHGFLSKLESTLYTCAACISISHLLLSILHSIFHCYHAAILNHVTSKAGGLIINLKWDAYIKYVKFCFATSLIFQL